MTTALMLTSIVILTIAGLIAHWRMLSPLSDMQSAENRDRTLGREAAFGAGSLQRDRQREALEDRMWVLSDQEARYRALLDRQADVISLRDASGRLTFVNEAFCQTFGVTWSNVVGTDFRPREIKAADDATPFVAATRTDVSPPFGRGELMSQVMTEHGPRWFEWRITAVPGAEVEWDDVQCVGRDVTDARDFATALAQARDSAEAANTAKSRFLASMSHEIRTPLNGIVGLTDGLKRTALDRRQSTYVESLDRSARILKALIDDILNFSKIEAGHIDLRHDQVRIGDWIGDTMRQLQGKADAKGLSLTSEIAPNVPEVFEGDPLRLRQVLTNLIDNAIKYTDAGSVAISVTVADHSSSNTSASHAGERSKMSARSAIQVDVRDTGPGFGVDDPRRLFLEFAQASSATRVQRDGLDGVGLGLAICARLVSAMDGRIDVSSNPNADHGAQVRLTIPMQAHSSVPAHTDQANGPASAPSTQSSAGTCLSFTIGQQRTRPHVLIVEDNRVNALVATAFLDDLGWSYDVATTGRDALDTLMMCHELTASCDDDDRRQPDTVRPDIVLLDIRLPDMTGFDVLDAVQQASAQNRVFGLPKFVAITANAFEQDRKECLVAGFDAYVAKPFDPDGLANLLKSLVLQTSDNRHEIAGT
ncbi:MAG: ATP-binding protein [Pseudomonadota bacterium]